MHVMQAPAPASADAASSHTVSLQQPLVGWRRCAKNMHDPNGLLDTRSASPRAPVSISAVGLEGILSEASSASSQKRQTSKTPNAKNIEKSCSIGKMRMHHPPLNSKKSKVMQVTWYNLTLDLRL